MRYSTRWRSKTLQRSSAMGLRFSTNWFTSKEMFTQHHIKSRRTEVQKCEDHQCHYQVEGSELEAHRVTLETVGIHSRRRCLCSSRLTFIWFLRRCDSCRLPTKTSISKIVISIRLWKITLVDKGAQSNAKRKKVKRVISSSFEITM